MPMLAFYNPIFVVGCNTCSLKNNSLLFIKKIKVSPLESSLAFLTHTHLICLLNCMTIWAWNWLKYMRKSDYVFSENHLSETWVHNQVPFLESRVLDYSGMYFSDPCLGVIYSGTQISEFWINRVETPGTQL